MNIPGGIFLLLITCPRPLCSESGVRRCLLFAFSFSFLFFPSSSCIRTRPLVISFIIFSYPFIQDLLSHETFLIVYILMIPLFTLFLMLHLYIHNPLSPITIFPLILSTLYIYLSSKQPSLKQFHFISFLSCHISCFSSLLFLS